MVNLLYNDYIIHLHLDTFLPYLKKYPLQATSFKCISEMCSSYLESLLMRGLRNGHIKVY